MASCEKCYDDSRDPFTGFSDYDKYKALLEARKERPCSPREQAGMFWDEERQVDTRLDTQPQKEKAE